VCIVTVSIKNVSLIGVYSLNKLQTYMLHIHILLICRKNYRLIYENYIHLRMNEELRLFYYSLFRL